MLTYYYIIMKFVDVSAETCYDYVFDLCWRIPSAVWWPLREDHDDGSHIVRVLFTNEESLDDGISWIHKYPIWSAYGDGHLEAEDHIEAQIGLRNVPLDGAFTHRNPWLEDYKQWTDRIGAAATITNEDEPSFNYLESWGLCGPVDRKRDAIVFRDSKDSESHTTECKPEVDADDLIDPIDKNTKEEPMNEMTDMDKYRSIARLATHLLRESPASPRHYVYYIAFRWHRDMMEQTDYYQFLNRHFKTWKLDYRNCYSITDDYGDVIEILVKTYQDWKNIIDAMTTDEEFYDKIVQICANRLEADDYAEAWCKMADLGFERIFGKLDKYDEKEDKIELHSEEKPSTVWKVTVHFRRDNAPMRLERVVYHTEDSYYTNPEAMWKYWSDLDKSIDHIEIEIDKDHGA